MDGLRRTVRYTFEHDGEKEHTEDRITAFREIWIADLHRRIKQGDYEL
jgi:hypothetical protein